ncbi:hypothetical protein BKA04_001530 [Cryobacterium mesophilum]|uniref:Uncharacterized protein n=1 Tax=Terrimesophilobacter mesophilus TaxID=433647 RepID=A0A4R8VBM7_9MICO|nr:hypothetical protein [Terrimesophilobacter mesophilus]MBB5633307.1 hypothetical protein [Terrimesophilobacter mesophilus]TFB80045.1 hypothetical protein E3N84_08305 [Terrimesophilobacter mesophilus]
MSDEMPQSFKDGEFGYAPCVMLGGPLDGRRYKLPILPNGTVPDGFGHPLQQPPENSPLAYYYRAYDETIGDYYVFIYQGTRGPGGNRALVDTPVIGENTCEGYGAGPRTESRMAERGE